MFVSVRQLIPQDLASIAPGPELARVLAEVELSRLSGFDCVEVLKAQYRQANHERARVLAAMVEVGMRSGCDDLSRRAPDEFSADEIRAALMLTRRAADGQLWLAHDLLTRLPAVHTAMDAGELDEPHARVLSEWTTGLSDDQARAVCTRLLPRVRKLIHRATDRAAQEARDGSANQEIGPHRPPPTTGHHRTAARPHRQ